MRGEESGGRETSRVPGSGVYDGVGQFAQPSVIIDVVVGGHDADHRLEQKDDDMAISCRLEMRQEAFEDVGDKKDPKRLKSVRQRASFAQSSTQFLIGHIATERATGV